MIFDENRVCTVWSPELEGKYGWFADDINTLYTAVNKESVDSHGVCIRGGSDAYPFMEKGGKRWKYFYPDETCNLTPIPTSATKATISEISTALAELLLYKNEKYGDSALTPINVFYQNKPEESDYAGILIRLDDKISRIKNRDVMRVNDVSDTIGYLMLLLVKMSEKQDVIAEIKKQMD